MARIRTIKPDFFKHEDLAELPAMVRLLFIGLWTQADRAGRLEDRPKRLKAEIFPYEDFDLEAGLQVLKEKGFILRYTHNSHSIALIQIANFSKHQQPNTKEKESTLPAPCQHSASITGKGMDIGKGKGNGDAQSAEIEPPPKPPKSEQPSGTKPPHSAPPPRQKPIASTVKPPWDTPTFSERWEQWKDYKWEHFKFQYKGLHSEQAALIELANMAVGDETTALAILQHTIANGWKGFVKPKNNEQQYANSKNRTAADQDNYERELAGRIGLAPNQSGFSPI